MGAFTNVVVELEPAVVGIDESHSDSSANQKSSISGDDDVEEATLTIRWFAGETADSEPEFWFHDSGPEADFGWHHEPNPHVEGWGHFQRREGEGYRYEPYSFSSLVPARVVWEVLAQVTERQAD